MFALFGFDSIKEMVVTVFEYFFFSIFYFIEIFILFLVHLVEYAMEIFTGEQEIMYNDTSMPLINMFFEHETIRGVYSGIGMIGIIFAFAFAIWSVIKRTLDLRGKQQGVTLGTIIGNLFKSIVLIFSMTAIVYVAIYTTNVLTQTVSKAIKNPSQFKAEAQDITFTDEQFAAMGRILNTIGNYSMNPSYRSRYNINACYNDIRGDLQFLDRQGVFGFNYKGKDGENGVTWQSIMQDLRDGYSINQEATLDTYDDGLTSAILDAMEIIRENPKIKALDKFEREQIDDIADDYIESVPMDRILFLTGTMGTIGGLAAARDDTYNKHPSFYDSVRYPFYTGDKNIYNPEAVRKVFTLSPVYMNYVLIYIVSLALLREMLIVIITCGVRIFNLLALYIASPLAIASMPLDDGGKFKQWSTAFVVQLLGIVGMVLSMRLFLMFLPIIWSPDLVIGNNTFDNILLGTIVKAIITYCSLEAVNKVNGIFTGILADNAGYQAIYAGDMRSNFEQSSVGRFIGKNMTAGGMLSQGVEAVDNKLHGKNADGSKAEKSEADKQKEKRESTRMQKNLTRELDSAKNNHGKGTDGKQISEEKQREMKHMLQHLQGGATIEDARKMAAVDMKQDKYDRDDDVKNEAIRLRNMDNERRNPPPGPGVDLPDNQNNQV